MNKHTLLAYGLAIRWAAAQANPAGAALRTNAAFSAALGRPILRSLPIGALDAGQSLKRAMLRRLSAGEIAARAATMASAILADSQD